MKTVHAVSAIVVSSLLAACQETPRAAARPEARDASFDLEFIDTMSKHHADGVHMARLAQDKVQHEELKRLTRKIPVDQQAEIDEMQAWRSERYGDDLLVVGETDGMDMSHLETMAPGPEYDVMFLDMMIPHHESAVELSKEALAKAEHEDVRSLARRIIDAQEREIAQMRAWKAAWAGADQK